MYCNVLNREMYYNVLNREMYCNVLNREMYCNVLNREMYCNVSNRDYIFCNKTKLLKELSLGHKRIFSNCDGVNL